MTSPVYVDRSVARFVYDPAASARAQVTSGATVRLETRDPRSGAILIGEPGTLHPYPPPPGGNTNALTGPISVEEAKPGDILKIDINRIRLEPVGYMAARDNGRVVPEGELGEARIGIVRVQEKMVTFHSGLQFATRPMIGSIGLAHPSRPRSGAMGIFGGNMDHPVVQPGATLYLPIFVPGALLYVGDVHAAMGDAELSGGGVEIAAEVELTVYLVKNVRLAAPRVETVDRIITLGWDHDFAVARQMATLDMLHLLQECLRISAVEAMMLISAAADLRLGQACGGMALTLRLEMPKLPGLIALPHPNQAED